MNLEVSDKEQVYLNTDISKIASKDSNETPTLISIWSKLVIWTHSEAINIVKCTQKFGTRDFVYHDFKIKFCNFILEEHHVS